MIYFRKTSIELMTCNLTCAGVNTPIFTARLAKRVKVMFSLCVSVHRGGSQGPISSGGGNFFFFFFLVKKNFFGGHFFSIFFKNGDKKNGDKQNGDAKAGGAGGTPLAVTQEDCLVIKAWRVERTICATYVCVFAQSSYLAVFSVNWNLSQVIFSIFCHQRTFIKIHWTKIKGNKRFEILYRWTSFTQVSVLF